MSVLGPAPQDWGPQRGMNTGTQVVQKVLRPSTLASDGGFSAVRKSSEKVMKKVIGGYIWGARASRAPTKLTGGVRFQYLFTTCPVGWLALVVRGTARRLGAHTAEVRAVIT